MQRASFYNACKLVFFFVRTGGTLQDNKGQKTQKDVERVKNKEERTVIHRNPPAVCVPAYSQVINTLKAFFFF